MGLRFLEISPAGQELRASAKATSIGISPKNHHHSLRMHCNILKHLQIYGLDWFLLQVLISITPSQMEVALSDANSGDGIQGGFFHWPYPDFVSSVKWYVIKIKILAESKTDPTPCLEKVQVFRLTY